MERRRIRRRRTRLSVQMEPGNITSMTGDLGTGGIFVHSVRVHKPGTRVRLVVATPAGPAEAMGVVRWAKRVPISLLNHVRGGMGIEFTWLSAPFRAYLDELDPPLRVAL